MRADHTPGAFAAHPTCMRTTCLRGAAFPVDLAWTTSRQRAMDAANPGRYKRGLPSHRRAWREAQMGPGRGRPTLARLGPGWLIGLATVLIATTAGATQPGELSFGVVQDAERFARGDHWCQEQTVVPAGAPFLTRPTCLGGPWTGHDSTTTALVLLRTVWSDFVATEFHLGLESTPWSAFESKSETVKAFHRGSSLDVDLRAILHVDSGWSGFSLGVLARTLGTQWWYGPSLAARFGPPVLSAQVHLLDGGWSLQPDHFVSAGLTSGFDMPNWLGWGDWRLGDRSVHLDVWAGLSVRHQAGCCDPMDFTPEREVGLRIAFSHLILRVSHVGPSWFVGAGVPLASR